MSQVPCSQVRELLAIHIHPHVSEHHRTTWWEPLENHIGLPLLVCHSLMLVLGSFLQEENHTPQPSLAPCVKIQARGTKALQVCDSLASSSSFSSACVVCMKALAARTRVLEGLVLALVCELVSLMGGGGIQMKVRPCAMASLL